jgi:hypothetical protein
MNERQREGIDARMRALERQHAGGDMQATADLVSERMRAGQLTEAQTRVAGFLMGGPVAARFLDANQQGWSREVNNFENLRPWIEHLAALGGEAARLRAGLAAAYSVLEIYENWCATVYPEAARDDRPRQALVALEAYLLNPNDDTRAAADAAYDAAYDAYDAAYDASDAVYTAYDTSDAAYAARAAGAAAADAAAAAAADAAAAAVAAAASSAAAAAVRAQLPAVLQSLYDGDGQRNAYTTIQQVIIRELRPWALGDSDPVEERVRVRANGAG